MRAADRTSLRRRAARVRLLLMDVDGVLTDGRLYYLATPKGTEEFKAFDSQDGIGLRMAVDAGLRTGVISGRRSAGVEARAKMLRMDWVVQETHDKVPAFERILREAGCSPAEAAFVGDDFHDVPVLRRAGFAVAVANARPEVRRAAHWTTRAAGGRGAVRETVELILRARGDWSGLLRRYEIL